jgi:hypothetical protein
MLKVSAKSEQLSPLGVKGICTDMNQASAGNKNEDRWTRVAHLTSLHLLAARGGAAVLVSR